jgi:hypothetical protein
MKFQWWLNATNFWQEDSKHYNSDMLTTANDVAYVKHVHAALECPSFPLWQLQKQ